MLCPSEDWKSIEQLSDTEKMKFNINVSKGKMYRIDMIISQKV